MTLYKRIFRHWLPAMFLAASLGGATLSIATPQTASAACNVRLLTFPAWYRGIVDDSCKIKNPTEVGGLPAFIFKIGLNIVEMMLQLVGLLSVAFLLVGGFKYILSTGTPDDLVKARKTILNALVGLVISLFSIGIVNIVVRTF